MQAPQRWLLQAATQRLTGMNPWPVFENGPGGGTQRSHRSAECNPPIRTVSLDCLGELLEAAATATFPSLFFTPYPAYSNQNRSMRSDPAHSRIPQSQKTSLAGKVPGRFAGSDVHKFLKATRGPAGRGSAAQVPWTLGKWCLGLQHRLCACWHLMCMHRRLGPKC